MAKTRHAPLLLVSGSQAIFLRKTRRPPNRDHVPPHPPDDPINLRQTGLSSDHNSLQSKNDRPAGSRPIRSDRSNPLLRQSFRALPPKSAFLTVDDPGVIFRALYRPDSLRASRPRVCGSEPARPSRSREVASSWDGSGPRRPGGLR